MNWITYILDHIGEVAAFIGLIYTTVLYVSKSVKSKNWGALWALVTQDIVTAEETYATGAERKQWVMSMLAAHAKAVNYPLTDNDIEKISQLIDDTCSAAKTVNAEVSAK